MAVRQNILIVGFRNFLKKEWAIPGLFLFIFLTFHSAKTNIGSSNLTNLKKRMWRAWDTNPGRQGGRHRRNH